MALLKTSATFNRMSVSFSLEPPECPSRKFQSIIYKVVVLEITRCGIKLCILNGIFRFSDIERNIPKMNCSSLGFILPRSRYSLHLSTHTSPFSQLALGALQNPSLSNFWLLLLWLFSPSKCC